MDLEASKAENDALKQQMDAQAAACKKQVQDVNISNLRLRERLQQSRIANEALQQQNEALHGAVQEVIVFMRVSLLPFTDFFTRCIKICTEYDKRQRNRAISGRR